MKGIGPNWATVAMAVMRHPCRRSPDLDCPAATAAGSSSWLTDASQSKAEEKQKALEWRLPKTTSAKKMIVRMRLRMMMKCRMRPRVTWEASSNCSTMPADCR
ncbi:hypothetical protein ACJRO7_020937 [Eucalyptus globulus]|uniref:Uncharacterized protein n=1 Tax=Eucalyptus globulus TaxID=34317 RepID=A0ABD3KMN7_EUCGL